MLAAGWAVGTNRHFAIATQWDLLRARVSKGLPMMLLLGGEGTGEIMLKYK